MRASVWMAIMLGVLAGRAQAAGYRYETISMAGAVRTAARALNDSGVVAGDYDLASGQRGFHHCFIYKAGVITTINPPGSTYCTAYGISADGTVVGTFTVGDTTRNDGFTYKDGKFTVSGHAGYQTLFFASSPNGTVIASSTSDRMMKSRIFDLQAGSVTDRMTVAYSQQDFTCVNDKGVAGGYDFTLATEYQGLIFAHGKLSVLSLPGATSSFVEGINAAGTIAGDYIDAASGLEVGFVDQRGAITSFHDPNLPGTSVGGINDAGDIAGSGYSAEAPDAGEGFVILGGTFSVVPPPPVAGITQFAVYRINNARQLLGDYFDASDYVSSVLITPQ